ncbi:MAG TPA: signal peptidase I [Candidatus Babeliaceae bacterium]|nr:signal peptidase I [Candidatus Babeliaceae bacterium]
MVKQLWAWYHRPNKSTLMQYVEAFIVILPIAFVIRTFFYGLYQVPTGSMETTMLVGERFFADKLTVWFKPPKRGEIIAFNDPTYPYSNNTIKNWWQRYVWGPSNWTKRVIGEPGDHVVGKIEDGHPVVYVNGKKLDEPYLNKYPLIAIWEHGKPNSQDVYLGNRRWCDNRIVYKSYDPTFSWYNQPFYRVNPESIVMVGNKQEIRYPATPNKDDEFDIILGPNEYWAMGDNREGSWDSRGWGKLDGKLIHGKITFRIWSSDSSEAWWIKDLLLHPIDFWKRIRWSRCLQFIH